MIEGFFEFLYSHRADLLEQVIEHMWLTMVSVSLATIMGIGLGILITKRPVLAPPVLWVANAVQTIPSIALLGVLLPFVGIGPFPAIIALFLYGLLPIIRNTYAGIAGVDSSVREAAAGMGLSDGQVLRKVELPLATPVIFAGIRTAFVINVGVATLCALIAAGGLGEFIFRGLATNNSQMILAGAIPAALIALTFDGVLGYVQHRIRKMLVPVGIAFVLLITMLVAYQSGIFSDNNDRVVAGFPSEFIERGDGYTGLKDHYNLTLDVREMEIGLMYEAVRNGSVDVISGFSTDGRIEAFDLHILDDDKNYFPPYHAAPLIRNDVMEKFPEVVRALKRIEGMITDSAMTSMNYRVDEKNENIEEVAASFLASLGLKSSRIEHNGNPDIIIGSKNFTESFILATIFKILTENYTGLKAELKLGFGGTKLLFDALNAGEVDLYPEYTGTGLLVILQPQEEELKQISYERDAVYEYVQRSFKNKYNMTWLSPLGFNNTFALMSRSDFACENDLKSISDLAALSRK